jgi:drug/metabolite transporter (DMT)-like permease
MSEGDVIGSILSIASSILSNTGINTCKRAHHKINTIKEKTGKDVNYMTSTTWWAGMIMVITGAIGDFLALGFGSQSLMTAIGGASTLAANVGISHFWLKETVSWLDITGVGCIITGAVIVCVYTPGSSPNQDLHSLLENSGSPQFALYMATVGVFIAVLVASIANTSFYKWRKRLINIVNLKQESLSI